MNAQEAIERIEKRIVWLKNKLGRLNGIVTHSEEINEIKNEIEALSIVLESAKLLHHPFRMIASHETYKMANGEVAVRLLDINNSHFAFVKLEEAKAIGIVEEVTE